MKHPKIDKAIKDIVLEQREGLIEMYKAGFLDGYKLKNKLKKKTDWDAMNVFYKLAFFKRFEKRITKELDKEKVERADKLWASEGK